MNEGELKRALSARDIWCLALGAMIGFGCFVLPGNSFLPEAGPLGTALGLAIGAVMVMVISVNFSYLIRRMPRSGGSFLYAAALFGKDHGFILGWFLILTYWSLVPLNATALGLIGRNLFPGILQKGFLYTIAGFDVYTGEIVVALFFIVAVAIVNLRGASSAGWVQTAITAGLVGSVLLVAVGVAYDNLQMVLLAVQA
jgi:amino acid transporter